MSDELFSSFSPAERSGAPENTARGQLSSGAVPEGASEAILPLAARMAPKTLDEFAGQEHLLGPGKMLRRLIESGKFASALFFGPPGSGKTALAHFIASQSNARVQEINAVAAGVADLKKAIESAKYLVTQTGRRTLLLVDEIHHFNRTQQDVLLPSVERGEIILIGLTTENPSFYVNAALLSRFTSFEFVPLENRHLEAILDRVVRDREQGLGEKQIEIAPDAREHFIRMAGGDARRLLNALELAALTTPIEMDAPENTVRGQLSSGAVSEGGKRHITLAVAEESIQHRAIRYDRKSDDHYDHISAFIKSMRGSDPDAAVYWMAKMLAAGEDPRFIARRILICAAEDVGNADFRALLIASAAVQAVEFLGMPEGRIPLAQAAIYIACAPKSNASYLAIDKALTEAQKGPAREVPLHLRDANMDRESRGHGSGYVYPHDYPGHYAAQEYMPKPMKFYEPSDQGDEKRIGERLNTLKKTQTPSPSSSPQKGRGQGEGKKKNGQRSS